MACVPCATAQPFQLGSNSKFVAPSTNCPAHYKTDFSYVDKSLTVRWNRRNKQQRNYGIVACAASTSVVNLEANKDQNSKAKCILVVGATGGVGQLVVAALVDRGVKVHMLVRNLEKAQSLFGKEFTDKTKVFVGDTRNVEDLNTKLFEGVTHVICCTGTTAFPSLRWSGDNTPEQTDWIGFRNLVSVVPRSVQRFVLVSSVGVTKYNQPPWSIMNLFGVLKFKKMAEDYLCSSGLPYTIIRPGRLTDGPYTSYDLNTLLRATSGTRRSVILDKGDKIVGEASRIMVAEACIQAIDADCTVGQIYELNSVEGEGPGKDPDSWKELFTNVSNK